MYQQIWTAVVGEVLSCVREPGNAHDRYAVAVMKNGKKIGHLPKKVSPYPSL